MCDWSLYNSWDCQWTYRSLENSISIWWATSSLSIGGYPLSLFIALDDLRGRTLLRLVNLGFAWEILQTSVADSHQQLKKMNGYSWNMPEDPLKFVWWLFMAGLGEKDETRNFSERPRSEKVFISGRTLVQTILLSNSTLSGRYCFSRISNFETKIEKRTTWFYQILKI